MRRFKPRRVRISPALVVSMIALFVALVEHGFCRRHRAACQASAHRRQGEGGDESEQCPQAQQPDSDGDRGDARSRHGRRDAERPDGRPDCGHSRPCLRDPRRRLQGRSRRDGASRKRTTRPLSAPSARRTRRSSAAVGTRRVASHTCSRTSRLPDLSGWMVLMFAESGNDTPANGSVWAICMRTS